MNIRKLKQFERLVISALWISAFVFVFFMMVITYPEYWKYIIQELGPMTWFETLLLFLIAVLAFICAGLDYANEKNRNALWWLVFAAGFLMLCIDERFAVHERIRDMILAPHNINLVFFWAAPGDIFLLIVMIAGILLLPFIIKRFSERKLALFIFLAAVAVSAISVISDSVDFTKLSLEALRMEQFVEELTETSAMLLYVSAVFLMFTNKLKEISEKT